MTYAPGRQVLNAWGKCLNIIRVEVLDKYEGPLAGGGRLNLSVHDVVLTAKNHGLKNENSQRRNAQNEGQHFDFKIIGLAVGTLVLYAGLPLAVYFWPTRYIPPRARPGRDVLPMRGLRTKYNKEQQ
jgi:hypothetical protein